MSAPSRPAGSPPPIVVGYSAKPEGRAALKRAIHEAELRDCELVVVLTSPDDPLDVLQAELAATGRAHQVRTVEESSDPAEELINAAEDLAAEFIVIGLRRRSPVGKLLLGSNAQRILLNAGCPVLAVKAESD